MKIVDKLIAANDNVKTNKIKVVRQEYLHKFFLHAKVYWKFYDRMNDYAFFGVQLTAQQWKQLEQEYQNVMFEERAAYSSIMSTLREEDRDVIVLLEPLQADIRHSSEWIEQWFASTKTKYNKKRYKNRV